MYIKKNIEKLKVNISIKNKLINAINIRTIRNSFILTQKSSTNFEFAVS